MSLVKRALFSKNVFCLNGCIGRSVVWRSPLSDATLWSAFRSACAEGGVELCQGIPEDSLVSIIMEKGKLSSEDAIAQLRSFPSFVITGGIVRITPDVYSEQSRCEAMLRNVAAKIPENGVSGSQLQAILEDEMPHFNPSAIGALSLRDAIQSHPNIFTVESDQSGKWTAKPVRIRGDKGFKATSFPDASSIVDFCRRRALVDTHRRDDYTPLFHAMQKTGAMGKDIPRKLLSDSETKNVLQLKLSVKLRPKHPIRSVFCFIDGDELSEGVVESMCSALNLSKQSTRFLARQPTSPRHQSSDIITPDEMPTSAIIDLKAKELLLRHSVVLRDIVYMCSSKQFFMYVEHVAKSNLFPDSDVYVCSPSKVQLVSRRQLIPL